jgi:deoxyribodipyrimidine photo-lyase
VKEGVESFVEELVVRRELAENLCLYSKDRKYDTVDIFPRWAIETLEAHSKDVRTQSYTYEQLEKAETHDTLWNACQLEMTKLGKMHGYMRMYWAKKILEWTLEGYAEALR